jgi:YggT family protein
MSYLLAAALFLIQVFFNALIVLFLVRTLLIAVGAAFSNPFCRFVYQLTNPVITPLRRAVPRWGRIELASLLVAYVLALVEFALMLGLAGALPSLPSLLLHALVEILQWLIWIELFAIFVLCIVSWFLSSGYNPNVQLLIHGTEPVVRPFRRLLPAVGGFDFSYFAASIALILAQMLVLAPLADLAARV